ncbi:MFS transporter [Chloroflexota bacterium]
MHFSHDLPNGLLMPLLPLIRADLGLSYLQSGLLISARSLTTGISQLPGGWLGDRFSKRIIIAIGIGGVGLAAMAIGLSSSYYPLLVILIIGGLFAGAYHPSATSWLSNYFEKQRRGKALSLHLIGGAAAFSIGPVLAGYISGMLGWRSSFIILSIPTLVAVLVILAKFRQPAPLDPSQLMSEASTDDGTQATARRLPTRLGPVLQLVGGITSLVVLMQLIAGFVMGFFSIYLVDIHNIDPAYAAMWLSVVRVGAIVGSPLGGWISDKWGRREAIFLALVATGPIIYLLIKLPFSWVLISVFILFGLLTHMRQATIQPFLMDNTPPELRGTVFGIYFGLGMEGQSLLQPVAGYFMDIFGILNIFNIIAMISIGMSLVVFLFAIRHIISIRQLT